MNPLVPFEAPWVPAPTQATSEGHRRVDKIFLYLLARGRPKPAGGRASRTVARQRPLQSLSTALVLLSAILALGGLVILHARWGSIATNPLQAPEPVMKAMSLRADANFLLSRDGVRVPRIIYGTAWKGDKTQALVATALRAGFRGIDTACQPKHYNESGVGAALREMAAEIPREEIYLQTKFTPISGQDMSKPIPYNPKAPLSQQVRESFAASSANLGVPSVDALILHSPLSSNADTLAVWREFEALFSQRKVKLLGISNCYELPQLEALFDSAAVKPGVLQNRFYGRSGHDRAIRAYCASRGILYQSFWTLSGNRRTLAGPAVLAAARAHGRTPEQVFFRFVQQLGIVPLSGTQSEQHMKEDLDVTRVPFQLTEVEMTAIDAALVEAEAAGEDR